MVDTIKYYNDNAQSYYDNTVNADMSDCYNKFLQYIPDGGTILDAGCGSGRDSKYFMSKGYDVTAIDGSAELCKLASHNIGKPVECLNFLDMDYDKDFDGIWACASLLHVDKKDIEAVIRKMYLALDNTGHIYASFKYGESDRIQGDRYFNDYNEETIKKLFKDFDIKELWLSDDVRTDRTDKWINIIARRARHNLRVVAAFIDKDGKILIAKRKKGEFAGLWEFPGGKYEKGETGEQAIKREIKEELELDIDVIRKYMWVMHAYETFTLNMDCYLCHLKSEAIHLHDHTAYRWVDKDTKWIRWVPADKKIFERLKKTYWGSKYD